MRVQKEDADGHARRVDAGPSNVGVGADEKLARELCQDARAVARAGVGGDRSPVGQRCDRFKRSLHDPMRASALDVRHEPHAA